VRAVELRAAGLSYDRLATAVGYANRGTAYNVVTQAPGGPAGPQRRPDAGPGTGPPGGRLYAALLPRAMQGHVPSVAAQQVTLNRRRDSFNARLAERAGLLTCLSSLLVVP